MRNRVGVILGLAVVSGLLAAYLAFRFLRQPTDTGPVEVVQTAETNVLIAVRDLEAGHMLTAADIRSIPWPEGNVPDGYGRDPSEVVGRGLLMPILANEPILASKIASAQGGGNGLQLMIRPGMRAVSTRITDESGVGGWLHQGMRVDVITTLDQGAQIDDPTTQTVLQDIRILRIGQEQSIDDQNQPRLVTVVTLEVDPDEAQILTLASGKGSIRLALRNPMDRDTVDLLSIRGRELITGRRAPVSTGVRRAAPPPRRSIEIIRRAETETVEATNGNGNGGN